MISKKDFFLTEYDASFLIFSKECDSESNSPVYSVHDLLNAPPPKKKIKIEIVYTTAYLYIVSRETQKKHDLKNRYFSSVFKMSQCTCIYLIDTEEVLTNFYLIMAIK